MQLNGNVQGLIDLIGEGGSTVTVTPILQSGIEIMTITVDNTTYVIYAPEGGGSEVEVNPILPSGTKIATINVNGVDYDIYSTDYSGDISSLQTGLSTANSNITALQGRMTTAEENITTLQSDMTAAEGDISTLQSGLSTANSNITTLQGRVTTAEGNITTLQSDMSAAEGDISTLQSGLSTANSNITALQGRVTTAEGNITTLQSDMSAAESIIGDGQLDIGNDLTDAVNEINQSLSNLETFSTAEQVIGKWIDGKPIYRKSYSGYAEQSTSITLDTLANVDVVIRGYGWSQSFNNNSWGIPSGRLDGYNNRWFFNTSNGTLALQFDSEYGGNCKYTFTIEYTKSTD